MKAALGLLAALLPFASVTGADPTWPSPYDELEEIMYQVFSFRARKFADTVSPCDNEASGPGRQNAAEWLRAGFHDMASANVYQGIHGLDASLRYELARSENKGPGFKTTFEFLANYYSRDAGIADLLALGVYFSVRSCGGPIIPFRAGRIDATTSGPGSQVPQVGDTVPISRNRFLRMGFNSAEMIQLVACGHTLGGVHSEDFPEIAPEGHPHAVNGRVGMDSSSAHYDNLIAVEYVAGNTTNPLVVGPSTSINQNSDGKIFGSDNNATITTLTDPDVFRSTCQNILSRMIDTVPGSVILSDPILPYVVKPVALQLTLNNGGATMLFDGYIRIHTQTIPADATTIVRIIYKNRDSGDDCGSSPCSFLATVGGITQGFDDDFLWFHISENIPVATGISSFIIEVNLAGNETQTFDNNGEGYSINDAAMLQLPNSCLLQTTGDFTAVAAVRNDRVGMPVKLRIAYKIAPAEDASNPVPELGESEVEMTEGDCVGAYTLYTASYTIPGGLSYASKIDIISGEGTDAIIDGSNDATDIGGSCMAFTPSLECDSTGETSSSSSVSENTTEISTEPETSGVTTETESTETTHTETTIETTSETESESFTETSTGLTPSETATESYTETTASETATETESESSTELATGTVTETETSTPTAMAHTEAVGEYALAGCYSEVPGRALRDRFEVSAEMTPQLCATFCEGYNFWATEYGSECFCGNFLQPSSTEVELDECNMECSGDEWTYCGAGDRLELYTTTAGVPNPTPSAVGGFEYLNCQKEGDDVRALSGKTAYSMNMTHELCAETCGGFRYMGVEYGAECFCGQTIDATSFPADAEAECDMTCAGSSTQICGGSSRLSLFASENFAIHPPSISVPAGEEIAQWNFVSCHTEPSGYRALSAAINVLDEMTLEECAMFCEGHTYFGTEYGSECYCGDAIADGSDAVDESECGMTCTGDNLQYCGDGLRLSLYEIANASA